MTQVFQTTGSMSATWKKTGGIGRPTGRNINSNSWATQWRHSIFILNIGKQEHIQGTGSKRSSVWLSQNAREFIINQDPVWISKGTKMWAPEYLSRACASTGPTLVRCRDHVGSWVSLGVWTSAGQAWFSEETPDVSSGIFFRGLNKCRVQLGSVQGHRLALRSVVGILHKGSTQPDSALCSSQSSRREELNQ